MTPTRNNVEPTTSATDELRCLLDERGVEWWQSANTLGCIFTRWHSPIFGDEVVAMENGEEGLVLFDHFVTPEQAIAATLGSCNCTNDCTNGERTRACLPHFWTHDGTLHIEATRMPTRIVVCEGGTCEFVPKRELDASEAENAKLRELVHRLISHVEHPPCEGCMAEMNCDGEHVTQCDEWLFMVADARKLGVEVDE